MKAGQCQRDDGKLPMFLCQRRSMPLYLMILAKRIQLWGENRCQSYCNGTAHIWPHTHAHTCSVSFFLTAASDLTPTPSEFSYCPVCVCASGNLRADRRQGGVLSLDDTMPLSPLMKPLYEEIPVFGITPLEQTVHVCACSCVCVSYNARAMLRWETFLTNDSKKIPFLLF